MSYLLIVYLQPNKTKQGEYPTGVKPIIFVRGNTLYERSSIMVFPKMCIKVSTNKNINHFCTYLLRLYFRTYFREGLQLS